MASTVPQIAVTGRREPGSSCWQPKQPYLKAIECAGGTGFALQSRSQIGGAAGLLLTGGGDVAPWRYGRVAHHHLGVVDEERDELELVLVADAMARDLPILAICRGMQILVVACGGTLWQDLPSELPHGLDHGQGARRDAPSQRTSHPVMLHGGTLAAAAAGSLRFEVNSSHHQAAQMVGPRLVVSGWAPDGVIEAAELPGARFILGVQWHPEEVTNQAQHTAIFAAFVAAARG